MLVDSDRPHKMGAWRESRHGCLEQLREHDVIWLPAESIHKPLSGDVLDNIFFIIISHGSRKLVEVHSGVVLAAAPPFGQHPRIEYLELQVISRPRDEVLAAMIAKKFQDKLPEMYWIGGS